MISAAESHVGCRRSNNEDSYLAAPEQGLFVVCDGMGGHELGELASRLAVEAIRAHLDRPGALSETGEDEKLDASVLAAAIHDAHCRVRDESEARDLSVHMGTTVVVALVRGDRALVANVGDSRAYLIGPDAHRRITDDHTVARLYAQAGIINEEDIGSHPMRGVLVRCLGAPEGCEADTTLVAFERGDRLLLCSDGLTEMLAEDDLANIVRAGRDPESAAKALVAAALEAGGRDNVTVVVIERPAKG